MKKVVTEEEINDILQNLKKEIEYYNLFMEDNDVISTIKEEKGDENKIRTKVKEIYENKKTNKINEMLNKFDRETNFQEYLNNKDVEEKILVFKLDENSIKKGYYLKSLNQSLSINRNQNLRLNQILILLILIHQLMMIRKKK